MAASTTGKRIAVVLSGCGVYDGSECTEAVAFLVALSSKNAVVTCFAPNITQGEVNDHTTGAKSTVERNVMVESARISRGAIKDLAELNVEEFDGIAFPGGFGVGKNLSDVASKGPDMTVEPSVSRAILAFHGAQKPQAFSCIAPVLAAKVIQGCSVTLGQESGDDWPYCGTVGAAKSFNAVHVDATVEEVHVDQANKVLSTPAYMYGPCTPAQAFNGISEMVGQFLDMA